MKLFNEWTTEERSLVFDNKINTDLLVESKILGFDNLENELPTQDLSEPFQIPPIPPFKEHLAPLLPFVGVDNKGRWLSTYLLTYLKDGIVIYQKIDKDTFKATLKFD